MAKRKNGFQKPSRTLLKMEDVCISTPEGRLLFDNLNMVMGKEHVAIMGRNGVGKSTLLKTIAGELNPLSGSIRVETSPYLVRQQLSGNDLLLSDYFKNLGGCISATDLKRMGMTSFPDVDDLEHLSLGQLRKLHLLAAKNRSFDLLLLDEPTEDMDNSGIMWLLSWLSDWKNGLIVVSHDRLLLSMFSQFIRVSELGCRYVKGTYEEVSAVLDQETGRAEARYASMVSHLERKEAHRDKVSRRRKRKKNYGRISELERCTPKQRLNKKRSLAQVSQGKTANISLNRIGVLRNKTREIRNGLNITLPLSLQLPEINTSGRQDLICLHNISAKGGNRLLFKHVELVIGYDRCAVVGPNGAGKTTLLNIIAGVQHPCEGEITMRGRIGLISQGGKNWSVRKNLLDLLLISSVHKNTDEIAQVLHQHGFPTALASRPLCSLSPGERVRAALICLFHRSPAVEVLVLDEPTYSLDAVGEDSLCSILKAWPGGMIIASHNKDFISNINTTKRLILHGDGSHTLIERGSKIRSKD